MTRSQTGEESLIAIKEGHAPDCFVAVTTQHQDEEAEVRAITEVEGGETYYYCAYCYVALIQDNWHLVHPAHIVVEEKLIGPDITKISTCEFSGRSFKRPSFDLEEV